MPKKKVAKKKSSVVKKPKTKKETELTVDFIKWISMGFTIASVGIGIAIILYILTSITR